MINNLKGTRIGVFHILEDSGQRATGGSGSVLWLAKCLMCGNTKLLTKQQMGRYQSCGCKSRDLQSISLRKSLNRGGYGDIYATHWDVIKKNAKQRNIPFNISAKYAWKLFLEQDRKCALTGVPLKFSTRCWSRDATASLDRIDSSRNKGYIRGNVQWVHKNINMMKQEYSTGLFFDWCVKVCLHNNLLRVI
jgi:hypothetical protein